MSSPETSDRDRDRMRATAAKVLTTEALVVAALWLLGAYLS